MELKKLNVTAEEIEQSVINQKDGSTLKIWAGSKAEYDALELKFDDVIYLIDNNQETVLYSITNNLKNITTDNSINSINPNESYTATLTPNLNYELGEVIVTMGGTDITSTAYSNGTISIDNVTGNIVIAASGVYQVTDDNIILNYYYSSDGTLTTNNQDSSVNLGDISSVIYREVEPNTQISITTPTACKHTICEYDEDKNFIQRNKNTKTDLTTYSITTSSTTKYVRIGIGGVSSNPDKLDVFKEVYNNTTVSGMNPDVCNTDNITTEV